MEVEVNLKNYQKTNVLIWVSIISFVIILTFLGYFLDQLGSMLPAQSAAQINQAMFLLAVVIAFGILFFKRSLFNPKKIIENPLDQSPDEKVSQALTRLRRNYIMVWAMGETIGIIGFINYMITVDAQYLLVFSVVSIYSILINMPRISLAEMCVNLVKENQ
jgi:hypothetical protein